MVETVRRSEGGQMPCNGTGSRPDFQLNTDNADAVAICGVSTDCRRLKLAASSRLLAPQGCLPDWAAPASACRWARDLPVRHQHWSDRLELRPAFHEEQAFAALGRVQRRLRSKVPRPSATQMASYRANRRRRPVTARE
jgi:hypothetical protein